MALMMVGVREFKPRTLPKTDGASAETTPTHTLYVIYEISRREMHGGCCGRPSLPRTRTKSARQGHVPTFQEDPDTADIGGGGGDLHTGDVLDVW